MAVPAQQVVLGLHHAGQSPHENPALAGEIADDFAFEGRGEKVPGADPDSERQRFFAGLAREVLEDGKARIDAAAVEEVGAHGAAGALRRHQDDIDVRGRDDTGLVLVDDGEAVREVKRVARLQAGLDLGPHGHLTGVGEQVLDHRGALGGFLRGKQGLTGDEAVGQGAVPGFSALALADNHAQAVVAHVEGLARALDAVAHDGDHLGRQHRARLLQGKFIFRHHFFRHSAEIELCHFDSLLLRL